MLAQWVGSPAGRSTTRWASPRAEDLIRDRRAPARVEDVAIEEE
jgi:hypothetical protein